MRMKVLHIIPLNYTLIFPLVQILNKYDKENEHQFLVTITFQSVLKNNPRLFCIRGLDCIPNFKRGKRFRRMTFILRKANQADHVVWHSFRTNGGYNPFLLSLDRKLLAKSTWIVHDGEIGSYTNVSNRFINHFTAYVNRYVQTHIAKIGVCFPSDIDVLVRSGVYKENIAVLPYPIPKERVKLLREKSEWRESNFNKEIPLIQIGMSSQAGNAHRQIIEKVMGLTEYQSACAFVPFQYSMWGMPVASGTKVYQKRLRRQIKKLCCRSICLEKQVSQSSFMSYIEQIDAVLLANDTACRLEYLFHLLAGKKRMFLPENSSLYRYLNQMNANIQPLEALEQGRSLADVLECPHSNLPAELVTYFEEETMAQRWTEHFLALNH